jgi:predicted transcriptional regulator
MVNNKDRLLSQLRTLGLSTDEAKLYLELLKEPSTHLRLSHAIGINRTKVYRLVEQLEKRSLVAHRTDDRGMFLVATDPATLEVELVHHEEKLKQQRKTLQQVLPTLTALQSKDKSAFIVRTYEGEAGLKQMCWHELKTQGELLGLGYGTIESIVTDRLWAQKHRTLQIAAHYRVRELVNETDTTSELASERLFETSLYHPRVLPSNILPFDSQTIIYNDTVAIYNWQYDQKVGVEIINPSYANMMRHIFEHYWGLGSSVVLGDARL